MDAEKKVRLSFTKPELELLKKFIRPLVESPEQGVREMAVKLFFRIEDRIDTI